LPLARVVETMRPLPVEVMAGTPPCVRGLAIVRGVPVPVIEVAALLREEERTVRLGSSARFVTVKLGDRTIALIVDSVVGVRSLAPDSFRELPPLLRDSELDVIGAIGTLDAELVVVLRAARLVPQGLSGAEVAR